ncbi:nucleoside-triphosphatase [Nitrosomonas sp. Nm34]|uniref:nucleoside-triphosphatase n=1 Tax=Nitrosomonas sp. Nm34 TaxID=1881055 RepID=UPI0008E9BB27|nr:nucleoside-triphosphatase [Nitrosomonas sp. Nm34]SFI47331.1 nucleoside-triphosphatase [Nitrosomonas sp. Nm34]
MLLITGMPGVGKTTIIGKVAEQLRNKRIGGFYTHEIRKGRERCGFLLKTFGGLQQTIAHIDFPHVHQVGKYGVDIAGIDATVASALAPDADVDLYLVDEIGKMECLSARFIAAMEKLFDCGKPLVATISKKGSGFIEQVKRRPDALLWEVTHANRDKLPQQVLYWLSTQ